MLSPRKQAGFSLIECLIAMVIVTVGLLAVAALAATAIQGENFAFSSSDATLLASSKLEELKVGALNNGGSLTSSAAGYSDVPNIYVFRRWQISDGPAGTKLVVVTIVPQNAAYKVRKTEIRTLVR